MKLIVENDKDGPQDHSWNVKLHSDDEERSKANVTGAFAFEHLICDLRKLFYC